MPTQSPPVKVASGAPVSAISPMAPLSITTMVTAASARQMPSQPHRSRPSTDETVPAGRNCVNRAASSTSGSAIAMLARPIATAACGKPVVRRRRVGHGNVRQRRWDVRLGRRHGSQDAHDCQPWTVGNVTDQGFTRSVTRLRVGVVTARRCKGSAMTSSTPRDWIATYAPDDPELRAAIRWHHNRFNWLAVPVTVVTYLVLGRLAEAFVGIENTPHAPILLLTVLTLGGFILVVAGIAVTLRPAARAAIRRNPRTLLTRAERRRVGKQIRGRAPVAAHEVPFLRDVALGTYAQWGAVVLTAGLVPLSTARALVSNDSVVVAITCAFALLAAGGAAFGLREVVRARRFLRSVGTGPV
jgi:hypothetical protein